VLRIAVDACSGLHAAHELRDRSGQDLNVVHRDVSPQNILVSEQGVVKVIDFGIAKARDRVSEETSSGSLKGKIHYMAPEQALGKRVDRRADVWAVGAVLYRLLARRPVYDGENQLEILHHLTTNQPLRPLPDDVPPSVARVVAVALAFDPDQRYESCAELRDALEATISAENLPCSAHELGTFVHQFLGERLEGRRQTLQAALRAASERPSAHQLRSSEVEGGLEPQPAAARPLSSAPIEGSLTSSSTALDAPPPRAGGHTFAWLALGAGLAAAAAVGVALTQQHTEPPAGAALGSATTIHAPLAPVALPSNEPLVTASAAQPSPQPSAASTVALKPKPVGVIAKPAALAPRAKPKRKAVNDGF
jgi:serine/threonine-protein kinase